MNRATKAETYRTPRSVAAHTTENDKTNPPLPTLRRVGFVFHFSHLTTPASARSCVLRQTLGIPSNRAACAAPRSSSCFSPRRSAATILARPLLRPPLAQHWPRSRRTRRRRSRIPSQPNILYIGAWRSRRFVQAPEYVRSHVFQTARTPLQNTAGSSCALETLHFLP